MTAVKEINKKILVFGSLNTDYVYTLDHIVADGETVGCTKLEVFPGGKGLNQAVAASRAGGKVYFAGNVDNDGNLLINTLEESGVNTSLLRTLNEKSGHAIIQVDKNGENAIIVHGGTNLKNDVGYIDSVLSRFSEGDIILLQNEINGLAEIISRASKKGMAVVLNPSPIKENISKIDFNCIAWLVVNENELKNVFGQKSAQAAFEYAGKAYPKIKIVATLGKWGAMCFDGKSSVHKSGYRVNAVDTTGAGDTFLGYFVAGIAGDKPIEETLQLAVAASAISVTEKGASSSVPKMDFVLSQIGRMKSTGNQRDKMLFDAAREYIKNNLVSVTAKTLAENLNCTPRYISSFIKKYTGEPLSKFVLDERLEYAAELLSTTDKSVSEVAYALGYENESFFRRKFKEKFGVSPKKYTSKYN